MNSKQITQEDRKVLSVLLRFLDLTSIESGMRKDVREGREVLRSLLNNN